MNARQRYANRATALRLHVLVENRRLDAELERVRRVVTWNRVERRSQHWLNGPETAGAAPGAPI